MKKFHIFKVLMSLAINYCFISTIFICILVHSSLLSLACSSEKRQALYAGLDPLSIREHLAFYELYKESPEGKAALCQAWNLLSKNHTTCNNTKLAFPEKIDTFISLISPGSQVGEELPLDPETSCQINYLCRNLHNRKLKGHTAVTLEEVLALPEEEIDLARAVLLSQLGSDNIKNIERYELSLDLMALQVLAKLDTDASAYDKITALNQFIFFEMQFRFPPHSSYSGKIDLFTFLPHILESRRGVCLGVSTLYLCLADRIHLDLEIITPPGHIYLRYKEKNIETTCRGVHIPSDEYLSINTKALHVRSRKEVIGMAHYNHASHFLAKEDFEQACACYKKALQFMPNDRQLIILYGSSLLLSNRKAEAITILQSALKSGESTLISENSLALDIITNRVDKENLKPFFYYVDETRASIIRKKQALEKACENAPRFRAGLFQLAMCWLQLGQEKKAIEVLEKLHALDPNDITVEFYLAELHLARCNAPASWQHYLQAEKLANAAGFMPKALKGFALELAKVSPKIP